MTRRTLALTVAILLAVPIAMRAQRGADVALRAAMETETVKGDLKGAIDQYRTLAAQTKDRAVAATALVRIAECYQKLGDARATATYQRVIADYADQKAAAALASERLARSAAAAGAHISTRELWTVPADAVGFGPDGLGTASPDGRYFSFVDWSAGDLFLHDFTTGQNRRLTNGARTRAEYAEESAISHDGARVAYAWFNTDGYEIRVLDLNSANAAPRVLFANHAEDPWVFPYDWSPDGKWIAVQIKRADGTGQLALVSAVDGALRVLKSSDWRRASGIVFSPDGKSLAYDIAAAAGADQHDIYLMATDATRETPAVVNPANDTVIGWTPDGRRLLFASDRSGTPGIWALPMKGDAPGGEPQLIKADVQLEPRGITRSGALYYSTRLSGSDIYVAAVDFASGKLLSPPARIAGRSVGFNVAAAWSPDGQSLAYLPRTRDASGSFASTLAIQSIATGEVRELRPNLAYIFDESPLWWPDGKSLLVVGPDMKGRWGIHRVDARTAETTRLVESEDPAGNTVHPIAWSADGQTLYFRRIRGRSSLQLALDIRTGTERLIREVTAAHVPSPDGRSWAAIDRSKDATALQILPADGGPARIVLKVNARPADLETPIWSPDGKFVIVRRRRAAGRFEAWAAPAQGGEAHKLDLGGIVPKAIRVHPDGHRLAIEATEPNVEVWVMEGLDTNR